MVLNPPIEAPSLSVVVEGITDEAVARRLAAHVGLAVGRVYVTNGKARLDRALDGYNRAASFAPWLVLRDLDTDEDCAPTLIRCLLPSPAPRMLFRIACPEVEAWLLADRRVVAHFLGVSVSVVPRDPESLDRPKQALVDLARRSRRRLIRADIVPERGTSTRVGPGYASRVIQFVQEHWRPDVAARHAMSLARCLARLSRLREATAN